MLKRNQAIAVATAAALALSSASVPAFAGNAPQAKPAAAEQAATEFSSRNRQRAYPRYRNDALGEIVERFTLAAGKREVSLSLVCDGGEVRFDRGQFTQVVSNLLDNAIRHARARSQVRVSCEPRGTHQRVLIENAGEPIPAEELPKIEAKIRNGLPANPVAENRR